jgi:hypothetical protein
MERALRSIGILSIIVSACSFPARSQSKLPPPDQLAFEEGVNSLKQIVNEIWSNQQANPLRSDLLRKTYDTRYSEVFSINEARGWLCKFDFIEASEKFKPCIWREKNGQCTSSIAIVCGGLPRYILLAEKTNENLDFIAQITSGSYVRFSGTFSQDHAAVKQIGAAEFNAHVAVIKMSD